jgi:predicted DNA-binding WGR domain protein
MTTSIDETEFLTLIDPDQVKRDMAFDTADITTAMSQQAALYLHYSMIAVRCRSQMDRMKQQLELVENLLDSEHRSRLKEENPKVTEAQIRSAVVTDRRWRAASQRLIDAKTQHGFAESVERSFEHRREMLKVVSSQLLAEREGSLRVVANQDARQRMLSAMQRTPGAAEAA